MKSYGMQNVRLLADTGCIPADALHGIEVVGRVLPFRVNEYVVRELIDWSCVPKDPIFQLSFSQPQMLPEEDFAAIDALLAQRKDERRILEEVSRIRSALNPHPDGQITQNIPELEGRSVPGIQHKYPDTCLIFPSAGQPCHTYSTYCFRWAQFVTPPDFQLATDESFRFAEYVRRHREITDLLLTGGDPLVMSALRLASFIEPLLGPDFEHVRTIRIGSNALATWPHRFVSDRDADDLLRLFERVVTSGRHLALMAHYSHARELGPTIARRAITRIQATGAVIRTQGLLARYINDSAADWSDLWTQHVALGCVPYYMFVARQTGAHRYFEVPLGRALEIFSAAYRTVSGLGRTIRGPVMSTQLGKVVIEGTSLLFGERVFVLSFVRARQPQLCRQPFFAQYDPAATLFDQLSPAFANEWAWQSKTDGLAFAR